MQLGMTYETVGMLANPSAVVGKLAKVRFTVAVESAIPLRVPTLKNCAIGLYRRMYASGGELGMVGSLVDTVVMSPSLGMLSAKPLKLRNCPGAICVELISEARFGVVGNL